MSKIVDAFMNEKPSSFCDLTNRSALVTGAASGIGRAIALELAAAGADLLIHTRASVDMLSQTADQIASMGRHVTMVLGDLRDENVRDGIYASARKHFPSLDICINNAGVDLLTGDLKTSSYEQKLQLLLEIDVTATALISRTFAAKFRDMGHGVILNIGWDQADRGMEGDSGELFATAKNAIMGLTRSLACTYAPEVRINCIAPGWIQTAWGKTASDVWQKRVMDETPLKRWGLPRDIAQMARFLVSEEASFITGQVINVNGGVVR